MNLPLPVDQEGVVIRSKPHTKETTGSPELMFGHELEFLFTTLLLFIAKVSVYVQKHWGNILP